MARLGEMKSEMSLNMKRDFNEECNDDKGVC